MLFFACGANSALLWRIFRLLKQIRQLVRDGPHSHLALTCVQGNLFTSGQLRHIATHTWHCKCVLWDHCDVIHHFHCRKTLAYIYYVGQPLHLFSGRNRSPVNISCIFMDCFKH